MNVTKQGFTLIELLIVISIIGLTLGIGLPGFQATIASNRLDASVQDMTGALQFARSEATKQVRFAGVEFNADGKGWDAVLFGSPNQVIQSYSAAPEVNLKVTSGDAFVRYRADGRVMSNAPIVMKFTVSGSTEARQITIKPSGAVSIT